MIARYTLPRRTITQNAKNFTDTHGITYIDYEKIMEMIDYASEDEFQEYVRKAFEERMRTQIIGRQLSIFKERDSLDIQERNEPSAL